MRFALLMALALLAPAVASQSAQAASFTRCRLSERDQGPPGGTPAYDLLVTRKGTSCRIATKLMVAFHGCRKEGRAGCARKVLGSWRCSGRRAPILPLGRPRVWSGGFTCASGRRRVRGSYDENSPACFGAAERDPKRPCVNPAQTIYANGSDPHALDEGAAGCHEDETHACVFGAAAAVAKGHFAVVGDSHVFHWRAALSTIVRFIDEGGKL